MQPFTYATALASELTDPNIWYPTILGVLVVVAGILLFVGSIYLILGTNMGARLAFLVTFASLMGFMVVLTSLWITTASPLNTLRGSVPKWEIKEVVPTLEESTVPEARTIQEEGARVPEVEAANIKAAVDEGLVTKVDNAVEEFTPEDNEFAAFSDVTEYLVVSTYAIGGSSPSFLDFEFTHTPHYAVVEFCGVRPDTTAFGLVPAEPECAATGTAEAENNGFVVLEYNLGDVRLPPIVAFFSFTILFGLSLLMLGWYEKDRRALAAAKESAAAPSETTPDRVREPVNA